MDGASGQVEAVGSPEWAYRQGTAPDADPRHASAWLDRARRLLPSDGTAALAAAWALQPTEPAEAARLLDGFLRGAPDDLAVLLARVSLGQVADGGQAAAALTRLLRQAAPALTPGFRRAADAIARRAGAPGWMALDAGGTLHVAGRAVVRLDGVAVDPAEPLPAGWHSARCVEAEWEGRPLLGSPIPVAPRAVSQGFVLESPAGEPAIWSWRPADPAAQPRLRVRAAGGRAASLGRPRWEALPPGTVQGRAAAWWHPLPARLLAGSAPIHVLAEDGTDIWGSPYIGHLMRHATRRAAGRLATHAAAEPDPWRPLPVLPLVPRSGPVTVPRRCCVIIPVHDTLADLVACVESILADPHPPAILVVDDASRDPGLHAYLATLAAAGQAASVRHPHRRGYPAAVNTGIAEAARLLPGCDVLLLNPDTLVAPGWVGRLAGAAYADPAAGSATPLTGDGTLTSAQHASILPPVGDLAATVRLDRLCAGANAGDVAEIPTAVGFCMFIKAACLAETGPFRDDVFAQGYGEENDWCMRARALGWRHLACLDVFVAHHGGRTFGAAKQVLLQRNLGLLNRLHPGYDALVAAFEPGRALDPAWQRVARAGLLDRTAGHGAVLLVSHALGGGTARFVAARCRALKGQGLDAFVLQPGEVPGRCSLMDAAGADTGVAFDLGADPDDAAGFLRRLGIRRVELNHLLGHPPAVAGLAKRLGVAQSVFVHDYGLWCPRVTLVDGRGRYCGEPQDVRTCEACVADAGHAFLLSDSIAEHRSIARTLLLDASDVTVPASDVAARLERQFPGIRATRRAWDAEPPPRPPAAAIPDGTVPVTVVGAIGVEKGYDVLLACARDAARRNLPLAFSVLGITVDDTRLMDTGKVFVSGRFEEDELPALLVRHAGSVGFLPSIWPETWCYALTGLWSAGLHVFGFDIGAQAERIRARGGGTLLPLGMPAGLVNDRLIHHHHTARSTAVRSKKRTDV